MTTFDERGIALNLGRELMTSWVGTEDMPPGLRELAGMALDRYPGSASMAHRLEDLGGYGLLLAVRSIETAAGLIARLSLGHDAPPALTEHRDRARHVAWHFPEEAELKEAVGSPHAARWWAAFYLDRPPGRDGLLREQPAPRPDGRCSPRQRLEALRRLPAFLDGLARESELPPLAVSEAQTARAELRPSRWLELQFHEVSAPELIRAFEGLERGCQLVEAVSDGVFAAGPRSQALAQTLRSHLPRGEEFPVSGFDEQRRGSWIDWLLSGCV